MSEVDSTRRKFLAVLVGGAVAQQGIADLRVQAQGLPHVEETDKVAVMYHYIHDAKKVDKAKEARYKPDQTCLNCGQLQGKDGETWRPCKIMPGKSVNVNGWCRAWVKLPAAK